MNEEPKRVSDCCGAEMEIKPTFKRIENVNPLYQERGWQLFCKKCENRCKPLAWVTAEPDKSIQAGIKALEAATPEKTTSENHSCFCHSSGNFAIEHCHLCVGLKWGNKLYDKLFTPPKKSAFDLDGFFADAKRAGEILDEKEKTRICPNGFHSQQQCTCDEKVASKPSEPRAWEDEFRNKFAHHQMPDFMEHGIYLGEVIDFIASVERKAEERVGKEMAEQEKLECDWAFDEGVKKGRAERTKEIVEMVKGWKTKYPVEIFSDPWKGWQKDVHELAESKGKAIDNISVYFSRWQEKLLKDELIVRLASPDGQ